MCVAKFSKLLVPFLRLRVLGIPGMFLCSPLVVPYVTVPFPDVNVVCEFSDSDFEFVEPQTCSPSNKREASVAWECETEVKIDRPSKLCQKRSETGPRRKGRLSKRYQNVCEAERRRHQK